MKRWVVLFLLTGILLACSWSLLRPGLFRVHDYVHAARIGEMTLALSEGHFPVRWSQNFGYGYGMPLFQFYAPLPFYVGAFFFWLGLGIELSVKVLFFIPNLITLVGSYLLGKKLFGKSGGVVVAAALTLSPYRAVNLFVRGAVSEAWGLMAIPWILLGIVLVIDRFADDSESTSRTHKLQNHGSIVVVVSLITLMLSHNLTTLLFVPISLIFGAGYGVWVFRKNFLSLWRPVAQLAGSYLLAVGAAAFYTVPALVENGFTKIDSILGGYFHYSQHFLYLRQFWTPFWGYGGSEWGPNDGISFFLGFGQLLGLMTVCVVIMRTVWKQRKKAKLTQVLLSKEVVYFGLFSMLLGLTLFMSILKSKVIWDSVELMTFIQFPWRWLGVAITFVALLSGLGIKAIKVLSKRYLVMVVLLFILLGNAWYFRPQTMLDNAQDLYYNDPERIQSDMSGILPDFIPEQMADSISPPEQTVWTVPESSSDQLTLLVNRGHEKLVSTSFSDETLLQFAVADFPGWTVEFNGVTDYDRKQVAPNGNIQVVVPQGQHNVGLYWGSTPVRHFSDWVSAASIFVFLVATVPLSFKRSSSPATS